MSIILVKEGGNMKSYFYEWQLGELLEYTNRTSRKPTTMRTLKKHIKHMVETGLITTENTPKGLAYVFDDPDGPDENHVMLAKSQIDTLVGRPYSGELKLFLVLKRELRDDNFNDLVDFKPLTRSFLAEAIGLSSKSNKNLEKITYMLNYLEKLEYIEINRDGRTNSYRILPYKK